MAGAPIPDLEGKSASKRLAIRDARFRLDACAPSPALDLAIPCSKIA
jgi:hypothetical protein